MTNWEDQCIQRDLGAYGTRERWGKVKQEREAWALSAMLKREALSRGIVKNFKPKNKERFVT